MDVRCNRCGTDYEFDDTLISDRGTTVQCTNCGYQFKIYPPKAGAGVPERWLVRTGSGKELVYTSLRDLQRAITDHKVGPKDLLSRGAQPPRPLGSIPELEPFFTTAGGVSRGLQSVPRTLHGVAPPPTGTQRSSVEPPEKQRTTEIGVGRKTASFHTKDVGAALSATLPVSGSAPTPRDSATFATQPAMPMVLGSTIPLSPPSPGQADTVRDPSPPRTEPPPKPGSRAPRSPEPDTRVSPAPPTGPAKPQVGSTVRIETTSAANHAPSPKAPLNFDNTLPAASPPVGAQAPRKTPTVATRKELRPGHDTRPSMQSAGYEATLPLASASASASSPIASSPIASSPRPAPAPAPPPISTRERLPSYDDLPDVHAPEPGRRARSRWIAGVVFIAVAGLLAVTVGRQYLARFSTAKKPELAARDERAARFLAEGNRLLARADYDGAQEQITKAQALADRDPTVLAARARLDTLRADLAWLKLRLLDPSTTALVQDTQRELGRLAGKARAAVEAAFAVAPEDPSVARARVDALRIAGEETKAREWIAPIAANAADPQNAYVLAALDLAEAAPVWSTVIDRLRAASVSEQEAARARGALVYALVRAGRVVEAETELAKVSGGSYQHPLAEELKDFVSRFSAPLDGGVDASRDAAATAESARAAAAAAPAGDAPEPSAGSGDFRARLRQAAQAMSSGEYALAQELYQSVTSELPGNTEALSGLADVARRRGDSATAQRLYEQVLSSNPSYLPALTALADLKWSSGDRKGAISYYRRVLEHVGPSTDYGRRASSRIAEAEGSSETQASPAPPSRSDPPLAPPDAGTEPSRPEIDTSDLPGVTPP
jgi:predicted Zn finger-like uncharacterized protein